MLLDPDIRGQDWLVALTSAAEGAYGADRALAMKAALERLSHALAAVAAAGPELDLRSRDALGDSRGTGGPNA